VEAGARRFLLFHHDPSHNDECIDKMVTTARELAANTAVWIDAAAENQTIRLHELGSDLERPTLSPTPVLTTA
jgi:hypothetical protein